MSRSARHRDACLLRKLQLGTQKLDDAKKAINQEIVTEDDTKKAYDLWFDSQPLVTPTAGDKTAMGAI